MSAFQDKFLNLVNQLISEIDPNIESNEGIHLMIVYNCLEDWFDYQVQKTRIANNDLKSQEYHEILRYFVNEEDPKYPNLTVFTIGCDVFNNSNSQEIVNNLLQQIRDEGNRTRERIFKTIEKEDSNGKM